MFQSIASCWPLLCWNKKGKYISSVISLSLSCLVLSLVLQNVIAMHAGKVLYSLCTGKHGARYKTNFISLKAVLTFQTLMLATLGKWATTHDRGFILGKNCSRTLLPGSTWLQTLITRLYQSSIRSYRTHFASLKHVDDLRVYRCLSTTRQATRYFKTMLKI